MTTNVPGIDTVERAGVELNRIASKSKSVHDIDRSLSWTRKDIENSDDNRDLLIALSAAFQYLMRHGRRSRNEGPFIPVVTLTDGTEVPPDPRSVPESWASVWTDLLTRSTHPAVVSRLADLLFTGRRGNLGDLSRKAVEAYLALVAIAEWSSLDRSNAALRAYEIAILTKQEESKQQALRSMTSFAEAELSKKSGPGVTLDIIRCVIDNEETRERGGVLLATALEKYQDPHITDQILLIERSTARTDNDRTAVDTRRVENWLNSAQMADGAVRASHLETASRIANEAGLTEERDRASRMLQKFDTDDLGLQHFGTSITWPDEVVEEYFSRFVRFEDWRNALVAVALHEPLTGTLSENLSLLDDLSRHAPLASLFRRVRLGGDGLPRWRPASADDERDMKLAEQEMHRFQLVGPLFAEALMRLGAHYEIGNSELVEFLSQLPSSDEGVGSILASAYALFWAGDFNSSAHIAIWQVEATSRQILLDADRSVYIVQRKNRPGQYLSLGHLFKELARLGLEESWYRYLWTVFASPAGLNLRNEVAHGFAGSLSKTHAAAILHAATYLLFVQAQTQAVSSTTQPS